MCIKIIKYFEEYELKRSFSIGVFCMITIDSTLCTVCGNCREVCPHELISITGENVDVNPNGCMLCGQCAAACPVDAVEVVGIFRDLGLETVNEYHKAIRFGDYDSGRLVQLMRSRRSTRKYSDKEVDSALLTDLVKIGTTAPSGTNSQSWQFTILPRRKDVEVLGGLTCNYFKSLNQKANNPLLRFAAKLFAGDALGNYYRNYYKTIAGAITEWEEQGIDRLFHGAAAAILVGGDKRASCPGEDALLATQNILLAAHTMGLGSCLIGFVVEAMRRSPVIGRSLEIPAEQEVYSVIALGYPKVAYSRVAGRKHIEPIIKRFG